MAYSVHRITGLIYGQHPRDVVFLASAEDTRIDAEAAFNKLKEKHRGEMLAKIEYWRRGNHADHYFHGFGAPYKECFVFKRKQAGTYYRYYGFLFNPKPLTDPGYQLCVLASHDLKNEAGTDPQQLKVMNILRLTPEVIAAIKKEFPELPVSTTDRR
jgi:hypothetical protein